MKLVPDIIDYYELESITQKLKETDPIWQSEIIKINRFGWNLVHGDFAIATAKTRDAKIP